MLLRKVVIGSAFGDEGKGLMTDYWASQAQHSPIVVRFNGGAQAGHTVVTPGGERHVFSHFGAGTLAGASTYLSKFFLVNPMMWAKEFVKLKSPFIYINPRCQVTTPFDMVINQFVEEHRGMTRHGSCGMGINETVTRAQTLGLQYRSTFRIPELRQKLNLIRDVWVPMRLKELKVPYTAERRNIVYNRDLIDDFISYVMGMHQASVMAEDDILSKDRDIIFEGAQGLLLDEEHHFFPHVTRSRTGLTNVIDIAKNAGLEELDVNYVSRAYTTRHGNGLFPSEVEGMSCHDDTNNPNPWQGTLRFGTLDLDLIGEAIHKDLSAVPIKVNPRFAITHLDQVDALTVYAAGYDHHDLTLSSFLAMIETKTDLSKFIFASGPTRKDISYDV